MDATPLLTRVGRVMREAGLEAVMIGNAAAALQGAPVTTVDVDFLFRKTPANLWKLKRVAARLGMVLFKPYYPRGSCWYIYDDDLALKMNFLTKYGDQTYESVKKAVIRVGGENVAVEPLTRKLQAGMRHDARPAELPKPKSSKSARLSRRATLQAIKLESELALRDQIRRLLAQPPGKRTHFLRKRAGIGSTCL